MLQPVASDWEGQGKKGFIDWNSINMNHPHSPELFISQASVPSTTYSHIL